MFPPSPRNVGWLNIGVAVAILAVTVRTGHNVTLLLRHGGTPEQIGVHFAVAIVVLGTWYWLLSGFGRFVLLDVRFRRAYARDDWPGVRDALQAVDQRGWMSDEWLAELGHAHAALGAFDEARSTFERIAHPLPDADREYARLYNHSYCIFELGEVDESRLIFDVVPASEWPASMARHIEDHEERLAAADAHAPLLS